MFTDGRSCDWGDWIGPLCFFTWAFVCKVGILCKFIALNFLVSPESLVNPVLNVCFFAGMCFMSRLMASQTWQMWFKAGVLWIFTGVLAIDEHEPTYGCWWHHAQHSIMLNVKCWMPQKTQTESIFEHPVETIMLHEFILILYLGASWSWIVDVTIFLGSHSCRFLPAWCRNFAVFGIQTATVDSRECLEKSEGCSSGLAADGSDKVPLDVMRVWWCHDIKSQYHI